MKDIFAAIRQHRLHHPAVWLERIVIWGGAICASCVVVVFAKLTEYASDVFQALHSRIHWIPLVLMPLGGMLVAYCVRRWFEGAGGSGIPQTIAAQSCASTNAPPQNLISLRVAAAKVVLGSFAVGLGFSTGREGPSVQVGASILHAFYRFLPKGHGISRQHLILAGGAAGISAAFNTPLAGIVFAIEELSRRFEQRTNGVLLTAIVLAGMVSISLQGNYLYFGHLSVSAIDHRVILPVLFCGLLCGVAGGLFSRALLWSARPWPGRFGQWRKANPVWFAGLCGLAIAVLGLLTQGSIHGSGYAASREMLSGGDHVSLLFAPSKYFATLLSYFSGVPGGIFAPCLAIGAGIGHDLIPLFGQSVAHATIFALCMAAFLGAVTQAPITSCIIVMEMIDGHEMVISLIAVTLIASLVARLFSPALYHSLAEGLVDKRVPDLVRAPAGSQADTAQS